jgi:hypothetical protein
VSFVHTEEGRIATDTLNVLRKILAELEKLNQPECQHQTRSE